MEGRARTRGVGPLPGALLAGLLGSCSPEVAPPASLHLTQFALEGETEVLLNEALDFHFDQDLDPASVTPASVRVVGPDGEPAAGRLQVYGSRLGFLPDLPLAPDLTDGGFRPATAYEVLLLGFPMPDGLRSLDGRPLAGSCVLGFRTVAGPTSETTGTGRYFEDPNLQLTRTLRLLADSLVPVGSIELEVTEAVDPSTLVAEDFELRGKGGRERIPLRARLTANEPDRAVIALTPVAEDGTSVRRLPPGTYHLWSDPTRMRLSDLGGNPVVSPWIQPVDLRVEGPPSEAGTGDLPESTAWWVGDSPQGGTRIREEFTRPDMRSPVAIAGADGTAWWDETGAVSILLPAVVGDGADGVVSLAGEAPTDVRATELSVPDGSVARFLPGARLVVLRAQGSLVVAGELRREGTVLSAADREQEAAGLAEQPASIMGLEGASGNPYETRPLVGDRPLSEWLSETRAADRPWTVLIAGGDLVVTGRIELDTPLLLVAGGRIRISGAVRAKENYVCGSGAGGPRFEPLSRRAALQIDAPLENPLAGARTWAVLSRPWRPPEGVERWLPAQVEGRSGGGSYAVRYLGERETAAGVETVGPVDDPSDFEGCDGLRFLVELTMDAGGPWFPPLVDSIELAWIPQAEEAGGR